MIVNLYLLYTPTVGLFLHCASNGLCSCSIKDDFQFWHVVLGELISFSGLFFTLPEIISKTMGSWLFSQSRSWLILLNSLNPLTTNVPYHIETSQLICNPNQLVGFYMMGNIGRELVKAKFEDDPLLGPIKALLDYRSNFSQMLYIVSTLTTLPKVKTDNFNSISLSLQIT